MSASVGNSFVVAEVTGEALTRAVPDIARFRAAAANYTAMGANRLPLYLYAHDANRIRTRMFSPLSGTVEDAATGSAATPLAALLLSLGTASGDRYELVQGTHGRSGEQLDTWEAVFSTVGEDGYPKRIFNKRTGQIDHDVAKYWKEHYDLSNIMQRDWKTLGPRLAGKLHFYVGEADTFYLDRAVHLLKDFMDTTTDPYYRGSFDFGVRKPHCYAGDIDPASGINQHYFPEMVKHMEETAPPGADIKSWKY